MERSTHAAAVRLRAGLLWLASTTLVAALGWLASDTARAAASSAATDFASLLTQGCAVAALAASAWLWILTTAVVAGVLRDPHRRARRVGPVRSLLLTACGVAALGSTTTAAAAPDAPAGPPRSAPALSAQALAGLPLPDRADGATPARVAAPVAEAEADLETESESTSRAESATTVLVRPGDSLWAIAARRLGPAASTADVASYWRGIHTANAEVVGSDPDLILPGQRLRLPD